MTAINRVSAGVVSGCTVAACIVTAAVLAQPQIRAFDPPGGPEVPGWGGVAEGSTLFMRAVGPVTMTARNAAGVMVKAASLPHNVHVVQGIGSKTLLQIDHEQWGRSTIELDVQATAEVWIEIRFDDIGRAHVNMLNQNQLRAAADAPAARRVSLGGCGDCDLPHDTPGCTDPECEALVCAQDTFCCLVEWDPFCVNHALAKCDCDGSAFDCAACPEMAVVNDSQVGITGGFYQPCPMTGDQWTSLAFPIQTGGADVDTVLSVHNSNTGEGDIYLVAGTCAGPDVTQILATCCCAIVNAPSGVEISNTFAGGPIATSDVDPTWVVMVFRDSYSFDVAFDSSTLGRAGTAYGNLSGDGDPDEWQDLDNYGFGACYFVDLVLTGNDPSECVCVVLPVLNDYCPNAEEVYVGPGGTGCIDGTTIGATFDPQAECVVPTTAPGVWYRVTGTGNTMTATTCEDSPPAGADYDSKISVFCGECPEPSPGVNCCRAWGGFGCKDLECESIVCAQDSYCCTVAWDSICAAQALTKCPICMGARELICVAGNDDDCAPEGLHSTVKWCSQAGAEHLILVHGFSTATGNFTLCVSDDGVGCPATVLCIPEPDTGGCCQCDGKDQFCTQETPDNCAALGGEFLGLNEPCTSEGETLIYESSPGVTIPDDDLVGVTDSVVVVDSLTIIDLNVDLVIDHTWLGDLCVNISKDGGPPVELIKRMGFVAECDAINCCGCSGDDMDVLLDDEAAESIEDQCNSPVTGTYYPDPGQLAAYDGMDAAGTWTLWANDNAGGDIGTLVEWSLHFALPAGETPCALAFPDQCVEGDDDDDDDMPGDDDDDGPGWWTD